MESQTIGDTQYTRGYIRDTDVEEVWATRASGVTEPVTAGDGGIPPRDVWRALTGPDAPTELGEQMQFEEELAQEVPEWDDREVQLDRLLQEHPDQMDMAREAFERGDLDQPGYDARIAELNTYKQQLEDELKTYDMERGEVAAQEPVLNQYAGELAEDGITAETLGEHDWQPQEQQPAGPEPEPAPEIEPDDDFDIDM